MLWKSRAGICKKFVAKVGKAAKIPIAEGHIAAMAKSTSSAATHQSKPAEKPVIREIRGDASPPLGKTTTPPQPKPLADDGRPSSTAAERHGHAPTPAHAT